MKKNLKGQRGFTLIELLIVVGIIAILSAIAVPNFVQARTRSNISRVASDMRSIAVALESYRADNPGYPIGTSDPNKMLSNIVEALGPLAAGFSSLQVTGADGEVAGLNFHTLTTPISYISGMPPDPFSGFESMEIPFAYRNAEDTRLGWILTSAGPDRDLLENGGKGSRKIFNPLSTAADQGTPPRLGDINEAAVIDMLEGTGPYNGDQRHRFWNYLSDLTYDPTNGAISQGDIARVKGNPR
jgi:prepilin-type N-terminal cleavage/methylation domain-containing protein